MECPSGNIVTQLLIYVMTLRIEQICNLLYNQAIKMMKNWLHHN